ncbi:MAG: SH3 domain-containing protein [Clostridia bacterium]|nr:SH3 domain-containing protein [Clostridia bacterium]
MKKMRFAAAVLIAALLISTFALADVVATDNIKMRRGAGTNYGVITGIPAGTHMQYLDEICGEDGEVRWYKIKYQGKEGWIFAQYATYDGIDGSVASRYDLSNIENYADVSEYFGKVLHDSALEMNLHGYQETIGIDEKKYFDDKLCFAGVENIEFIGVHGGEFTLFGVAPGMNITEAADLLDQQGMVIIYVDEQVIRFLCADGVNALTMKVEEETVTAIELSVFEG